jgi:hypothetical protein
MTPCCRVSVSATLSGGTNSDSSNSRSKEVCLPA